MSLTRLSRFGREDNLRGLGVGLSLSGADDRSQSWKTTPEESFSARVQSRVDLGRDFAGVVGVGYIIGPAHRLDHVRGGVAAYLVLIPR